MSRTEWEEGTIKLPTAEVATVKKAIREVANAHHDAVVSLVRETYRKITATTRSLKRFEDALSKMRDDWYGRNDTRGFRSAQSAQRFADERQVLDDAHSVLSFMLYGAQQSGGSLHLPTAAEIAKVTKHYTNKDNVFVCGEAAVSFSGNAVTWSTGENNHAVDTARASWLGRTFFDALAKVHWTRGSGGDLVGNDEYTQDSRAAGGGGNYVTQSFGPERKATGRGRSSLGHAGFYGFSYR